MVGQPPTAKDGTALDNAMFCQSCDSRFPVLLVEGNLTIKCTGVSAIICDGTVTCDGTNTIVHDASLYTCPPDGHTYLDGMSLSPGSWRQTVD